MYKPSKVKHPSIGTAPGKNKKGEPAYASTAITPAGPESTRDYTSADEAAYAESSSDKSISTGTAAALRPDAELTTREPLSAAAPPERYTENRTGEETHKPVLNVDEQKKVVNQPASSAAANNESEEF